MNKPKILVQFDVDRYASVFDAVVAVDSGVDQLLQYADVKPEKVRDMVYGAMFTRGPSDLNNTAIFVGGSQVAKAEALVAEVTKCFFGPMRVSVMMDANGSNTTAAAAVVSATRHVDLKECPALVLGGTGPVGQRSAKLLALAGASVHVGSRNQDRAAAVCQTIHDEHEGANLTPVVTDTDEACQSALDGVSLVIAAGAPGTTLLTAENVKQASALRVAIDLNAVPPLGIEQVEVQDAAATRDGVICYGAIGVGGTKMRIHKASLKELFLRNDRILDAQSIYEIGLLLEQSI